MVAFAAASLLFEQYILAAVEGGVILFLVICSLFVSRRRRRELMEYIESVTYDADTAKNNTLLNFPLPMARVLAQRLASHLGESDILQHVRRLRLAL